MWSAKSIGGPSNRRTDEWVVVISIVNHVAKKGESPSQIEVIIVIQTCGVYLVK